MSDIMKLIKNKLKGSTTMPAGTGQNDPVHALGRHDHHAHHHHGAGCCSHDHNHKILHEPSHRHCDPEDDFLDEEEDVTTPGSGCC